MLIKIVMTTILVILVKLNIKKKMKILIYQNQNIIFFLLLKVINIKIMTIMVKKKNLIQKMRMMTLVQAKMTKIVIDAKLK